MEFEDTPDPADHREHVEPWLSALFQSEHLSLLVGNGLTTAVARASGAPAVEMAGTPFSCEYGSAVEKAATASALRLDRGAPNLEDLLRAALELIGGLRVLAGAAQSDDEVDELPGVAARLLQVWKAQVDQALSLLLSGVLATERGIAAALSGARMTDTADHVRALIGGFLLPFASRAATRERLHIFTTNYDRLIEYGCDLLGIRVVDRFVGILAPVFHTSRLGVDLHYNPPGIRGEPRYLEGVVRLTKLHGSIDWQRAEGPSGRAEVQRRSLPFGAATDHPECPVRPGDSVLVYPNPAKDTETLEYPYAEMFRDFAAATCQPNSVVVTYGYGFGDEHVNRVLRDMLTLPSTHLAILSYDAPSQSGVGGRLRAFCENVGRHEQITLLAGSHFGDLATLITNYLPKPAIDLNSARMMELVNRRLPAKAVAPGNGAPRGTSKEAGL